MQNNDFDQNNADVNGSWNWLGVSRMRVKGILHHSTSMLYHGTYILYYLYSVYYAWDTFGIFS